MGAKASVKLPFKIEKQTFKVSNLFWEVKYNLQLLCANEDPAMLPIPVHLLSAEVAHRTICPRAQEKPANVSAPPSGGLARFRFDGV